MALIVPHLMLTKIQTKLLTNQILTPLFEAATIISPAVFLLIYNAIIGILVSTKGCILPLRKSWVQANIEAAKLDAYWSQMRLAKSDVIGLSLLKDLPITEGLAAALSSKAADNLNEGPTLLDALQVYLDQKATVGPRHSV